MIFKAKAHYLFTYPENNNLHHGRFLFRHKGKRKKGKPNYPPTKMIVKTARRWSKSKRGWRKLWRAEEREMIKARERKRQVEKAMQGQTQQMFTRRGPVGNVMPARESVVRETVHHYSR